MYRIHLSRLQIFYLLFALLSITYVCIRALSVGVTYDEAWTINGFVPQDFDEIFNYTYPEANNHILNTVFIKLLYHFFDDTLFLARLPNLLAFVLYVYFAYKLAYKYLTPFIGLGCFLLLLLNPFVLDFFGLARGYGLALGFEMAALYFALKYFHSVHIKNALFSLFFASIAVFCNFTFLNFYLVLLVVLILITFSLRRKMNTITSFSAILSFLIITAVLGKIIYAPIQNLREAGSLYFGGESFYSDTLLSLTSYSMYDQNTSSLTFVVLNCFILLFLVVLAFSYFRGFRFSSKNIFVLLLSGLILSLVLQNLLFDTLYLINRTALLFYPIIIFTFAFSLKELNKLYFSKAIMSILLVAFTLNFFANTNFYKTATWYFEAHTQEVLGRLNEEGKSKGEVVVIEYSWPFRSSIGYYLQKNEYPFVKSIEFLPKGESINKPASYYIYLNESLENVGYYSDMDDIKTMEGTVKKTYPKEKIIIYSLKSN